VDIKRGVVKPSYKELIDITTRSQRRVLYKLQVEILKTTLKEVWRTVNDTNNRPAGLTAFTAYRPAPSLYFN